MNNDHNLNIVGWIHEDELPDDYPYELMFPYSKVDVVRMFPIFGPPIDHKANEQRHHSDHPSFISANIKAIHKSKG